jgi:flagellar biosynthesis component FlhA
VVKPFLNRTGDLPAFLLDTQLEQSVEAAVQHGEQNSHVTLSPPAIRDLLQRIQTKTGTPETPAAVIAGSGARFFLRQMVEPSNRNLFFISHNEVPMEVKIISQGVIQ